MINTIDNKLTFSLAENDTTTIKNNNFVDFVYTGDIFGMIDEDCEPVSHEQTINRLSSAKTIEEIVELVRFVVGNNWFIIKDTKNIYMLSTMDSYPYLFYKKKGKLYFTHHESEICTLAVENKEKISQYDLYDLFTTGRSDVTLYGGLFRNITRIPNGHVLTIYPDLTLSYYSYLNNKNLIKIRDSYSYFKKILEATAQLYGESGKKIYVIFSGGIDSFVVLLACRKFSNNVHAITTAQEFDGSSDGGYMREIMLIIKEDFGIDVDIINADRFSPSLRKIRDEICKLNSGNNAIWDSYVWYSIMEKYQASADECIFVTGQVFDSGYGIEHQKMFNNARDFATGWFHRYFFSRMYQHHLDNPINKKMRGHYSKDESMDSKVEYLTAMMHPKEYEKKSIPVIRNKTRWREDSFLIKYLKYKEQSYVKCAFDNIADIQTLPKKEINKKIRILRHYFSTTGQLKTTYSRDAYSHLHTYHLPGDGPMMYFFTNHQLGWIELIFTKRYVYKYFREVTGKNHFLVFNPFRIRKYSGRVENDTKGKWLEVSNATPEKFLFSPFYQQDFFTHVDLEKPVINRYLKDVEESYIKRYIQEYYMNAKRGLLTFRELQRIYNIEIFLKNLTTEDFKS